MDLIIKSPFFPLYQRGMFYDSPLWQRGVRGDFTDNFFTFYMIIVHKFGSFSLQVGKVPLPSRERVRVRGLILELLSNYILKARVLRLLSVTYLMCSSTRKESSETRASEGLILFICEAFH